MSTAPDPVAKLRVEEGPGCIAAVDHRWIAFLTPLAAGKTHQKWAELTPNSFSR
jgi:hypothetical protein